MAPLKNTCLVVTYHPTDNTYRFLWKGTFIKNLKKRLGGEGEQAGEGGERHTETETETRTETDADKTDERRDRAAKT